MTVKNIAITSCELSGKVNTTLDVKGKHAATADFLFGIITKREVGIISSDDIIAYRAIFPENKLSGAERAGEKITLKWNAEIDGKNQSFHATTTVQALDTRVAFWVAITNTARETAFVNIDVIQDSGDKSARGRKATPRSFASAL
jgi:hypothetical protein